MGSLASREASTSGSTGFTCPLSPLAMRIGDTRGHHDHMTPPMIRQLIDPGRAGLVTLLDLTRHPRPR
jgi:hypothetical protein